MKPNHIFLLLFIAIFSSCVNAQKPSPMKKVLIVYYSFSGNTEIVANQIKEITGGDIFELQPVKPYPEEYDSVVSQAKKEISTGFCPDLKAMPDSMEKYDVVLIGSPCWWYTMAPPMFTFLSENDFSGKTIALFMTHGGSGLGHSIPDLQKKCPGASIQPGLAIYGDSVKQSKPDILKWLQKIELISK